MLEKKVSAIIVSCNTSAFTRRCIESLFSRTNGIRLQIIVVDNASVDGSPDMIQSLFPEVILIRNHRNVGFGSANNQGMALANGRYFLLLNSDAEICDDTLAGFITYAERWPEVGLFGCRVCGPDGSQQQSAFRFFSLSQVLINSLVPSSLMRKSRILGQRWYVGADLAGPREVDVVSGCCMFLRREVYEETGGFDEDFFMYAEEFEWCYRIRQRGWKVLYIPDLKIIHYGGQSTKCVSEQMYLEMDRSQVLFFQKAYGGTYAYIANLLMTLRDLPRACIWVILRVLGLSGRSLARTIRLGTRRFFLHAGGVFRPFWVARREAYRN